MSRGERELRHAHARRADRQLAVGEHDRPLLRRVPAQREGASPTSSCRGPMARSSRACSAPPASSANFGVYLYDTEHLQRHPILDDPDMWDIFARPLAAAHRAAGHRLGRPTPSLDGQALIGAMNVYESSSTRSTPGEVYGVRIMEGFSSEEGFPRDVRHDDVRGPREPRRRAASPRTASWLATVPANVPLHLQTVDIFGMSLVQRARVVLARAPAKSRVCGGCHEDRAEDDGHQPRHHARRRDRPDGCSRHRAARQAHVVGRRPREPDLIAPTHRLDKLFGMAWDKAVQPIFDAKCVSCHDGTPQRRQPDLHDHRPDDRREHDLDVQPQGHAGPRWSTTATA